MARKNRWGLSLRHPKTFQELKANQDKNDPYIRPKRRKKYLPTVYWDLWVIPEKNWKYLKRNHQYRTECNYQWHEFKYSYSNKCELDIVTNIEKQMDYLGCYYEFKAGAIRWYGPSYLAKGRCQYCYSALETDILSNLYGDWCPNLKCNRV